MHLDFKVLSYRDPTSIIDRRSGGRHYYVLSSGYVALSGSLKELRLGSDVPFIDVRVSEV